MVKIFLNLAQMHKNVHNIINSFLSATNFTGHVSSNQSKLHKRLDSIAQQTASNSISK